MNDDVSKALPASLWVYLEQDRIGTLYPTEPLSFDYAPQWLARPDARPLHPDIPLAAERIAAPVVHAFFENLLPEGDQRTLISLRHHVSSVFGLLATVGGDTASAIVLTPQGQTPAEPVYQALTWEQVHALVHADAASAREREAIERAAAGLPVPRISISGAQFKLLLMITPDGTPHRPMGASPSTHILKPDMVRSDIKVFASAVNEAIVMRAAQHCGLPTANVAYQLVAKALLVERYDRVRRADGSLGRLWQADFCQMLGKPSDVKYELDGGPTFKDCYALLQLSSQPAVDRRNLLRWLFFNLYVGNHDSHAKNLALLAAGEGLRLAPFYDLMSTRVYAGLGPNFAFSIGGEFEPGKIGAGHLRALAHTLGVAPKYLLGLAHDMIDLAEQAISKAVEEISAHIGPSDKVLAQRLELLIVKNIKQMRKRLLDDQS